MDFDQHTTVKKRKSGRFRLQFAMTALDQPKLPYRRQLEAAELSGLGAAGAINRQIEGFGRYEQRK
ncbi:hypothetical protein OKC48_02950 [Methylorubrum extorquens]|uniref:hypothetical protein n=1 Tax=Methylorubrum extorquens TaxID=408 RepID=UPI002238BD80|nr:hypothetical protein [Methylorubrum extorquens]UYW27504.1 hypothetical protein OKC48_02950 [Methylorubrum extorquens]